MSWLRIDDGYAEHRKLLTLTRSERWTWTELLCYCARQGAGHVPAGVTDTLRHVTPKFLERCADVGLLDRETGTREPNGYHTGYHPGYRVHDWEVYNGTTTIDRVRAFLEENPQASGNEIHKQLGGKREHIFAALKTLRASQNGGTQAGTREPPDQYPDGTQTGTETGTQTGTPRARARTPAPTPGNYNPAAAEDTTADAAAAELLHQLADAGWNPDQTDAAATQPDLAQAWLQEARRSATTNVGGYAWRGFTTGSPPIREHGHDDQQRSTFQIAQAWLDNVGRLYDAEADVSAELDDLERRHGPLAAEERGLLLAAWRNLHAPDPA